VSVSQLTSEVSMSFVPVELSLVNPGFADTVPSPAHDSMTEPGRIEYLACNPLSYLTVTRSHSDIGPGESATVDELETANLKSLDHLLEMGAFDPPSVGCFHLYELSIAGHSQVGVVGGVATEDFDGGRIKPHEQINPKRAAALARHFQVVQVQSSPIALGARRSESLYEIKQRITAEAPDLTVETEDGLTQRVWIVKDHHDNATIGSELGTSNLYVLDGHHRAAAAVELKKQMMRESANHSLAVIFDIDDMANHPFHRVLPGIFSTDELMGHFQEVTSVRLLDLPSMLTTIDQAMDLCHGDELPVYIGDSWYAMDAPANPDDISVLAELAPQRVHGLLMNVLGKAGYDSSAIGYRSGLIPIEHLIEEIDQHGGALAGMAPVSMDELLRVADAGYTMPPKSTYFEPKVRAGVFLRRM